MSFGGGDSPTGTTYQTQYTRDAPQVEAAKLGLMQTAKEYTQFGMNPWEAITPGAKPGEEGYGQYKYTGETGPYVGKEWSDLTREQRSLEGQAGGAGGIPTQQVAGFDPMQQQGFQAAQAGIGTYQPYLNLSSQYAQQATQAYDPTSYQAYMNPYQDQVIGAIEQQFDKAQNLQNQQATSAGAFGGARQGIQSAELTGQRAQTVGTAQAQNYAQAQQQAQAQFGSQMGRLGAAAGQIAGLGGQQQQQQMGDIASLMSAGSVQQQRQQQVMDAQYQQSLQQLYEPYQRLGFTSDIYQGNVPSGAMAISMGTAPGTNPLAQTVGAGITGLAGYQALKGG
tara:strand:- start:1211 stop:2221 length:1011 start_codon:yes stop_codon:yes gene_type:complete